jgi:hypothetical protein
MKLYEISEQYKEVQNLIESDDTGSMRDAIADTMQMIAGDFKDKAQAVVSLTLNMDGNIAALDNEIQRLQDKRKIIQNRIDSVRDYLKHNMEATGISKIECPLFTITLSKPAKQVEITDESLLPDEFVRVKTTVAPDKVALAKAFKEGKEITGAILVDGASRLIIK